MDILIVMNSKRITYSDLTSFFVEVGGCLSLFFGLGESLKLLISAEVALHVLQVQHLRWGNVFFVMLQGAGSA